jgi:GNAT superfamily N-acetyltransferase
MSAAVRTASERDLPAVVRLLSAQLSEHGIGTPEERIAFAVHGLIAEPARGFVVLAEDGTEAVGVAYVSFVWALEHGGKAAWLEELFVVPERRQAGLGSALLSAAIEGARERGASAIDLEVDVGHARAEHLYARRGFVRLPRARWVLAR